MAEAFPSSTFIGFDAHGPSITAARKRAADAGVGDRARFEVAHRAGLPGQLRPRVLLRLPARHGRSGRRLRRPARPLEPGGTVLLVEPMAGDRVEDNLNPVGAAYYGFSTLLCTPNSLSQDVGSALGAQAGEARLRDIADRGRVHLGAPRGRDARSTWSSR